MSQSVQDVALLKAMRPLFHFSFKNPPPCLGPRTACWPLLVFAAVIFFSSHFYLPEIQQGTKYLWCFNPTCQCAGAFAFICSALLCYTLHIWRPSIPKSLWLHSRFPRMFKLLQKTELLDLFVQLPRPRRDAQCLQLWLATQWLLWLVCANKERQIITTNLFGKLTGHKTERCYRLAKWHSCCLKTSMLKYVRDMLKLAFYMSTQAEATVERTWDAVCDTKGID